MVRISRYQLLSMVVILMALIALVMGTVFVVQGVTKANWMKDSMRLENITLGLDETAVAKGEVVDSASEAQAAADMIREHRRGIAPTYDDLLAGGSFDPANPQHLSYAQALNMENYLYLGVLGFGVTTVIIGTGTFMIIMGIALSATGVVLLGLARRTSESG